MKELAMPNVTAVVTGQRERNSLSEQVTSIETREEGHLRAEFRKGAITLKAKEYLGKGAQAVTDAMYRDGEHRFVAAVDRNEETLEAERSPAAREKIAKYLAHTEQARAVAFSQVAATIAEEAALVAAREFAPYVAPPPPPPPSPTAPSVAPKQKVLVVTKGNLFRPDRIEEIEIGG